MPSEQPRNPLAPSSNHPSRQPKTDSVVLLKVLSLEDAIERKALAIWPPKLLAAALLETPAFNDPLFYGLYKR